MAITGGALTDANGDAITGQNSGTQVALDVGVNVNGIQVDPRNIRNLNSTLDNINISDITGTVSLPTGAATAVKQDTGNLSIASLDGKTVHVDTGNVTIIASALPTGSATSALQTIGNSSLLSIDAKLNSLGQKVSSASVPVVISSDQPAIPVITQTSKGGLIDHSGVVGTTSTSIIPANANRKYLLVQNLSGAKMYINFGAAATQGSGSVFLAANGGSFIMEGEFLSTDQLFIICSANNSAYTAKES